MVNLKEKKDTSFIIIKDIACPRNIILKNHPTQLILKLIKNTKIKRSKQNLNIFLLLIKCSKFQNQVKQAQKKSKSMRLQ